MKILLVNSLYAPNMVGGAERSVQELAEALVRLGHTVSVACLGKEQTTDVVNGVDVHYLRLVNVHWPFGEEHGPIAKTVWHALDMHNPQMARAIGDILDKVKPDVVHTNNLAGFSVAVWGEAAKHKVPIVHTIRDLYLLCVRSSMFRAGSGCEHQCSLCGIFSRKKLSAARQVNHVVGISRYVLQTHQRYKCFEKTPSSVIYNGFRAVPQDRWEKKEAPLRFGFMGRLAPAKGVDFLINTYLSSPVCSNTELLIAGEGHEAYTAKIKEKISGSRARLVGRVAPSEFFSIIDILVVPSLWEEPLGRVVIEAYAHGVPVIVSNRGGLPEIVEEGRTGHIFEPDDPSALRYLLEKFTEQPELARRMAPDCLDKASDFLPEYVAGKYIEIYSHLTDLGGDA